MYRLYIYSIHTCMYVFIYIHTYIHMVYLQFILYLFTHLNNVICFMVPITYLLVLEHVLDVNLTRNYLSAHIFRCQSTFQMSILRLRRCGQFVQSPTSCHSDRMPASLSLCPVLCVSASGWSCPAAARRWPVSHKFPCPNRCVLPIHTPLFFRACQHQGHTEKSQLVNLQQTVACLEIKYMEL